MSIPLVQKAEKDDINTSIIAIKRNIERINMLLGLVDSGGSDPDLSGLATKQELQDAVESLQPVDEVTVGNMQSVTSNAVAEYSNKIIKYKDVTFTSLSISAQGYADVRGYVPSGMNNFLFALLWDFGSTSSSDALGINAAGTYVFGTANSTISRLELRYYYTD